MRVLVVTPYPPVRDGIAAYAVQSVAALRRAGHEVEVLSPGPSAAHHHLDLVGPRGALALAKRVRGYDRVVVQFHPDFFYGSAPLSPTARAAEDLALTAAFRAAGEVEVVLHEIDYRHGRGAGLTARTSRALWRSVDRVLVHTDVERREFAEAYGVPLARVEVVAHGADFVRRTAHDRDSARRSLGLPPEAPVALAIGFLQPHKGFDRAVRAFAGLGDTGAELHVVGSVRVDDPAFAAHVEELRALTAATRGAHLHEGYVSDELFDRWIVAADVVVLPYRYIWSSGVLERTALYDRPVVATRVGGLAPQAGDDPRVTLVDDDVELRSALWAALGAPLDAPLARVADEPWPPADAPDLREAVQAEVVRRAAAQRGGTAGAAGPSRPGDGVGASTAAVAAAGGGGPGGASAPAGLGAALVRSQPLRRLPPLQLPPPTSARPGVSLVKRAIRRATGWEVDPLVWQVNALREATIAALERDAAAGAAGADATQRR